MCPVWYQRTVLWEYKWCIFSISLFDLCFEGAKRKKEPWPDEADGISFCMPQKDAGSIPGWGLVLNNPQVRFFKKRKGNLWPSSAGRACQVDTRCAGPPMLEPQEGEEPERSSLLPQAFRVLSALISEALNNAS